MNFATLKQKVKAVAFPLGEAENLVDIHDTFIVESLIDLQQYVPCFRVRNTNIIAYPDTRYNCGLTVVGAPDGIIRRIYTIGSDFCCKVNYRRSTLAQMRHRESLGRLNVEAAVSPDQSPFQAELSLGDLYPSHSSDSKMGRAITGFWAIEGCRLYLWPHIQSSEDVVIEWSGIKSSYADADIIFDLSIVPAVRAGLQRDIARNIEMVDSDAARFDAIYREAVGDLYHWCRQKTEGSYAEEDDIPVITNGCVFVPNVTGDTAADTTIDPVNVTTTFAIVGEYGLNTAGALSVASLVNGWSPDFALSTGGNNLTSIASYNGYDIGVGSKFHQLLFPYAGSYGAGSTDHNRFWPTISESDRASIAMLDAYKAFFPLPTGNDELYYDRVEGPVHFFFLDSSNPDGIGVGSPQAEWLKIELAASISPFKVVVVNCPPYSSINRSMFATGAGGGTGSNFFDIWVSDTNTYSTATHYTLVDGEQTVLPPSLYAWAPGNTTVGQTIPGGHSFTGEITYNSTALPGQELEFSAGSDSNAPFCVSLRWPFRQWGASLVIDGSVSVYERMVVDGLPYITNGLGGNTLGTFGSTSAPGSLVRYSSNFGAIRGTYSCVLLRLEFISIDGIVQDTLEIKKV